MSRRIEKKLLAIFAVLVPILCQAQTPLWGPETFVRQTAAPNNEVRYFSVPDSTWQYEILLKTTNADSQSVSSALITINGVEIVKPSELSQKVKEIRKSINLKTNNNIAVRVASIPGTALTISIYGPYTSTLVPPDGGTVSLPGIATVFFPVAAFDSSTTATLYVSDDSLTRAVFDASALVYEVRHAIEYEIRLNCGTSSVTQPFDVSIAVPKWLAELTDVGRTAQAFVQIQQTEGLVPLDMFVSFPSTYNVQTNTLLVSLPPWALTNTRSPDGTYEMILVIGTTPEYWMEEE